MRSYVVSVSLIVLLCCGPSCRMPGMGCDQPNSRGKVADVKATVCLDSDFHPRTGKRNIFQAHR